MVVFQNKGPQYRLQNTIIIGPPKMDPNFGKPLNHVHLGNVPQCSVAVEKQDQTGWAKVSTPQR